LYRKEKLFSFQNRREQKHRRGTNAQSHEHSEEKVEPRYKKRISQQLSRRTRGKKSGRGFDPTRGTKIRQEKKTVADEARVGVGQILLYPIDSHFDHSSENPEKKKDATMIRKNTKIGINVRN